MPSQGKVYIIGAGPGDPELLTLKAKRIIDEADVIIYADSLVPAEIAGFAKPGAAVYGSKDMALPEIMDVTLRAVSEGKIVARIQSGDPSLYGATLEQMRILEREQVDYEIIPGVSAIFAAAAVLKAELTVPEVSQTVIMTRAEGRVPMPEGEALVDLARHQSTLAIFLSVTRMFRIANQLQEAGYSLRHSGGSGLSGGLARRANHTRHFGRHRRESQGRQNYPASPHHRGQSR